MKRNKTKKRKITIYTIIEFLFILLIIFSIYKIYKWNMDNNKSDYLLNEISKSIVLDEDKNIDIVNFDALKKINEDTVAYLKIEGTGIEYPIVKTNNNDYYLKHSFDKKDNSAGWIFADYRCKVDGMDKNLIIYGHNRRDGSMFGNLKNILNSELYENNNRYIILITEFENMKFQVFSVYQIEKEDYYIQTNFNNESYKEFLNVIKKRSIKDFETDVTEQDNVLTLSTCANDNKYRIVVHAKRIQ